MHFRSLHDARLQGFRRAEHHFGRFRTRGFSPVPLSTLDVRAFSRRDLGLGMCIFGRSGKLGFKAEVQSSQPLALYRRRADRHPAGCPMAPAWVACVRSAALPALPALRAGSLSCALGLVDFAKPCWPMTSIRNQIRWTFRTGLPAGEPRALDAKSSDTAKEWTSLDA